MPIDEAILFGSYTAGSYLDQTMTGKIDENMFSES
jgi:hypothetical protein